MSIQLQSLLSPNLRKTTQDLTLRGKNESCKFVFVLAFTGNVTLNFGMSLFA